jgi:hypothetical protein
METEGRGDKQNPSFPFCSNCRATSNLFPLLRARKKLSHLKEAGFNGSHLSQIVVNAGWEVKLKRVQTVEVLALQKSGKISHNKLAKLLKKK